MESVQKFKDSEILDILDLSVRSSNRIKFLNVNTIGELTSLDSLDPPDILCSWTNKAAKEIMEKLSELDLKISMTEEDWINWEKTHIEWLQNH